MTHVFISHSTVDVELTRRLVDELERVSIICWTADRDIPLGEDYQDALHDAIVEASAVVFLASEAALASRHCRREITLALDNDVRIIPVRLDGAELRGGWRYNLVSTQWLEGTGTTETWIARLAGSLGRPSAPASTSDTDTDADQGEPAGSESAPPVSERSRASRPELYRRFWSTYLDRVRAQHAEWTKARPTDKSWISAKGPILGTLLIPRFRRGGSISHELYIDTGDEATTRQLFDELQARSSRIEEVYGRSLEWLVLEERRASQIVEFADGSVDDVAAHDRLVDWFIDCGERMRAAIASAPVDALDSSPSSTSDTVASILASGSDHARALDRRLERWAADHGHRYDRGPKSRTVVVSGRPLGRLYPQWDVFALQLKSLLDAGQVDEALVVRGLLAEIEPTTVGAIEPNLTCSTAIENWEFVETQLLATMVSALQASQAAQ